VLFFVLSEIYMIEITLRFGQIYKAGIPGAPTLASVKTKV
jgi:hypothetical protein